MEAKHLDFINVQFSISDFRDLRGFLKNELNFDIENFSYTFLRRRISHILFELRLRSTAELIQRLTKFPSERSAFLQMLEVPVTEFFRDPGFWRSLKELLQQRSGGLGTLSIWMPSISSGEEFYSLLILVNELGIAQRVRIHASNLNSIGIVKAKEGVVTLGDLEQSTRNYFSVFNKEGFGAYFTNESEFKSQFLNGIQFDVLDHTIAFSKPQMDIIIFRNILVYYNSMLSNQILSGFYQTLKKGGILALGSKERIETTYSGMGFTVHDAKESMYKKP